MARKLPVGVFVVGIVNLIFGVINLLSLLASGVGVIVVYLLLRRAYQSASPQEQQMLDELWPIFSNNIPALVPTILLWVAASFVLTILQVVGGWGCVRIRAWGRWTVVLWGALSLLELVVSVWYSAAILQPGLDKVWPELDSWLERQQANQPRGAGQPPPPKLANMFGPGSSTLNLVLMAAGSLFQFALSGGILVFMLLPATGRAIDRYNAPQDENAGMPREADDYYDEDYERQRRAPAESARKPPDRLAPGESASS
jgi:hypothetical protein